MRPLTEAANGVGVWPDVPREVADVMLPELDRATEEVIGAIQREVPEYARPNDDQYTSTVRRAVHQAVHQFVQLIADPATSRAGTAQLFADIGRIEAAEGRSLEPLQAALRLGARVTWRTLCEQAVRGSLSVGVIGPVGEALFLYLDELAAACAEGFARASAEVAGELERRRRRLLDLIVTDPPVSRDAIADLARAAGWAMPRRVAVVALEDRSQDHFGPLPALPPDVLVDVARQDPCLLVPDPDGPGRVDMIERGLRGWTGALGPVVPFSRASCSLRWARQVLALARRGSIRAGRGLIRCEEHLTSLVLLSDEELARVLSSVWLAPLSKLRPSQQDIIAETLLAWLQNAGNARLAASHLHVHPQTVRYRLRQIQELFGEALTDPGARFDLEVALRARQLLRTAAGASAAPAGRNGTRPDHPAGHGGR
jgi:PucR C-terminal helix-turn-helix domain